MNTNKRVCAVARVLRSCYTAGGGVAVGWGGMRSIARAVVAVAVVLVLAMGGVADVAPVGRVAPAQREAGPERGGLRMRLVVAPVAAPAGERYDVRVELVNVTDRPIVLRAA